VPVVETTSPIERKEMHKMRKSLVALAVVLAVAASGVGTAGAEAISPGGGNAFGQHVAGMAPEHAVAHGAHFGECVSTMARTGSCPHAGG
jgi:hypothetical protein